MTAKNRWEDREASGRLVGMDLDQLRAALHACTDPAAQAVARLLDALGDNPDRARAIIDMADSQLMLEHDAARPALPPYPQPSVEGELAWVVGCQARKTARERGEAQPICSWRRDSCGFSCQRCARWEGDETRNGGFIRRCFDEAERSALE